MHGKKTLEINPDHPAVKELREKVLKYEVPPSEVEDSALLLFDTALLTSGFNIINPTEFAARMDRVVKFNLNIDRFEKPSPFEVPEEEEETKEEVKEEAKEETKEEAKDDL